MKKNIHISNQICLPSLGWIPIAGSVSRCGPYIDVLEESY